MESEDNSVEKTEKTEKNRKPWIVTAVAAGVFVVLGGASLAASETYHRDRIFHGIHVGPLELGGMKRSQAENLLEKWHQDWWEEQLNYIVYDEEGNELKKVDFYPIVVSDGSSQSYEFVYFDLEEMLNRAYNQGRHPSLFKRLFNQLRMLNDPVYFDAIVKVDETTLRDVLELEVSEFETKPENAAIEMASASAAPVVVSENEGNTFDYEKAIAETKEQLIRMEKVAVEVSRARTPAKISSADINGALEGFEEFKNSFPAELTYHDQRIDFQRSWNLTWQEAYLSLTVVRKEDKPRLALDAGQLERLLDRIRLEVDIESQDAKFTIGEDERVEQFQPSQKGYQLDAEATVAALNESFYAEREEDLSPSAEIVVSVIEPRVSTADVNELGITEVIGVGYSNFSGSPRNRIHNIGVGAAKLDGLLIEPDEEFSLLNALKPFTGAAGYLPELVIKGDKIKPEIGGGLCQIGSTTFRAAMKSGLKISQRRNHSLVVSYYNDPRNGNPGTDATIYDPAPDLKFINDTGNYILIKTSMNAQTGDLVFTFWGTSDGRSADYTQPIVHSWIPAGPTKYVQTEDLEPGQERCQGAHPGANASFTYTVTMPDGTVEEEVYSSHYRALPRICLVGADPEAETEGEAGESTEDAIDQVDISDLPEATG